MRNQVLSFFRCTSLAINIRQSNESEYWQIFFNHEFTNISFLPTNYTKTRSVFIYFDLLTYKDKTINGEVHLQKQLTQIVCNANMGFRNRWVNIRALVA